MVVETLELEVFLWKKQTQLSLCLLLLLVQAVRCYCLYLCYPTWMILVQSEKVDLSVLAVEVVVVEKSMLEVEPLIF